MALTLQDRIAVVGAGAMGRGIAAVAAQAGHEVYLFDMNADAARAAPALIRDEWQGLVKRGKWTQEALEAAAARLRPVAELAELSDAALVVEAIVEAAEPKQSLFRQLEAVLSDSAILASNTSSISITLLARGLSRPERFAGLHFFNPATRMKLVEVIHGLATDPAVIDTLVDTVAAWGKLPVRAQSTPGFIVNRVARPYYAEGLRIVGERAAQPETVDALLREAGRFPMGPFELMDLIGHDVNYAVTSSVFAAMYQDGRFQPSLIQQERVAAGWFGRKTGRGFYDYRDGASRPAPQTEPARPAPAGVVTVGELGPLEALAQRLAEAGVTVSRSDGSDEGWIECGGVRIALSDGRTATQRAADTGHADWVLVDLALDYASTSRLAIAVADQATGGAADAATGLLQGAGISVSRVDDIAGMVVLRTMAMLANEAADTVLHGIASAADVDMAMRYGTNYPVGPLAWADAFGAPRLAEALQALFAHYGESRYRTSPLIRRLAANGGTFYA
ncbi:3-hydroxyacyl-CoA dehydrogenase PaaH [Crenobacter luteus]|uniref:3-hydroxyacyl-CoA dehydrogenase n=1 Tax=Crenobacter luteus TaxID=1452487 RepID=A0A165ENU9_9NEIS|nr:3-hydroxyacyl-CoA dehydrogenase PaaH [Crenobacter luteus]KZE27321.1 3-hydroxyacyl-CoA dehydrogenase [Crenobacter luteus]